MSRKVDAELVGVDMDGESVAGVRVAAEEEKIIRLNFPPLQCCRICLLVDARAPKPPEVLPCVLCLPKPVESEFRSLLQRMEEAARAKGRAGKCWCRRQAPFHGALQSRASSLHAPSAQALKEAVWSTYYMPFCSHFANILEDLMASSSQESHWSPSDTCNHGRFDASRSDTPLRDCSETWRQVCDMSRQIGFGKSHQSGSDTSHQGGCETPHRACAEMASFFLSNRMWSSASFLLTACVDSGIPVTLGPFELMTDDVEASRLKRCFLASPTGADGLVVGQKNALEGPGSPLRGVQQWC
eukprot:evm.model.scf_96.10 EVM.evm.TU.scf_96.10   scf_96:143201-146304(-)